MIERSALNAMVIVRTETVKAMTIKEVMGVLYFDIAKAYNTMWREKLLIMLRALGDVCITGSWTSCSIKSYG